MKSTPPTSTSTPPTHPTWEEEEDKERHQEHPGGEEQEDAPFQGAEQGEEALACRAGREEIGRASCRERVYVLV